MGSDNNPKITLDGDISPFRQKLREAAEGLKQFGNDGEAAVGRMTGPLKLLQERFVAIAALLAGGAVFKAAVADTVKFTEESTKLGRALGISASEASILSEALIAGNTSQDEFVAAARKLAKSVRENEDGLQAMGLKTRDAAGQLRPLKDLMFDAIGVVNGYRAGTDRAIAGQVMFGKGFEMTSNLALQNKQAVKEVEEQMRSLGVVVGEQDVQAWQDFDDAGDKANITFRAIKTTIGNSVLPMFTALAEATTNSGRDLVKFTRAVMETFLGFVDGFRMVKQAFVSVGSDIGALAAAAFARSPDEAARILKARAEDMKNEVQRIKDLWNGVGDSFLGKFRAQANQPPASKPDTGGKGAGGLIKKDKEKKEKQEDPSFMGTYEAVLAERKNYYEQENVLRQFSKEQELAYWRELQATYTLSSKDQLAIAKRTATLEMEIRRQSAKDQRDLEGVLLEGRRTAALGRIEIEEQAARFAQASGEITKAQLIAQEEAYARSRFEIEYQALLERLEMAKADPAASPATLAQIKEQMLGVEHQYLLRRADLQNQAVVESASIWRSLTDTIGSLWDKGINAMMNGTLTWRNAWRAIGTELVGWFATEVVGKQVKEWLAGQAKMLAVKLGFAQSEKAIQAASTDTVVAEKGKEVLSVVAANAAEAGSGAAASQAAIPIVGPGLALAAMAAVFAAVMAMTSRKSAARGYDIPKGLNPLVQTHEEEMILPQKYANVIRGMAAGGAAESNSAGGDVHIYARNDADVVRVGDMKKLLREMGRNFVNVRR